MLDKYLHSFWSFFFRYDSWIVLSKNIILGKPMLKDFVVIWLLRLLSWWPHCCRGYARVREMWVGNTEGGFKMGVGWWSGRLPPTPFEQNWCPLIPCLPIGNHEAGAEAVAVLQILADLNFNSSNAREAETGLAVKHEAVVLNQLLL